MRTLISVLVLITLLSFGALAEDGYRLWLRYDRISNPAVLTSYRNSIKELISEASSPTLAVAVQEVREGLHGLLAQPIAEAGALKSHGAVILGTPSGSGLVAEANLGERLKQLGNEGFLITNAILRKKRVIIIAANEDIGVLYGAFHFLRLLQTNQSIEAINITSAPRINVRMLNHWDNLDRMVERGYAGFSIWDWHKLPDFIDPRYIDYARANASIGINGTAITNVNANALILTPAYLEKVAALAKVFRPYGIKVYLTARFSAPMEIGGLQTADPLDEHVHAWWKEKAREIYSYVPDFGGFLVKANSEGQPGPQNYGRSHADGANMLADAVAPFGGVVMWRAFVYDDKVPDDRARQAYNEFKPYDGKFRKNVLIQVKNGPIDFQPREPFHPMFGAMPSTPLMMEFQITQEYTGFSTHLVYLANQFKECLESDTYAKGKGSTVARVIDGTLDNHALSGIAGVANIGTDRNWTGYHFGQANWYAFGRLAWDHTLSSGEIAEEWIRMTWTNDNAFVTPIKTMMDRSWEITVNYMTPLGLHHIMDWSHHYGPGPWIKDKHRADWTSVYYHQASKTGIGFDRTPSGSNAVGQYFPEVSKVFSSREECPEKFLLWFHHVGWSEKTTSGRTLWDELCYRYYSGADSVGWMQKAWNEAGANTDRERFNHVKMFLNIQQKEALWWRNACVLYFQTFSGMAIPKGLEPPEKTLDYYQQLKHPYAPGIRPQW